MTDLAQTIDELARLVAFPTRITQAHRADEFIDIAQIDQCLGWLGRLADRVSPGDGLRLT